jgi:hypothetical protein
VDINREQTMLRLTLAAAVALACALVVFPRAEAASECATLTQARARSPHSHLYWHSSRRCWDARPAHPRGDRLPPIAQRVPVPRLRPRVAQEDIAWTTIPVLQLMKDLAVEPISGEGVSLFVGGARLNVD